MWSKLVNVSVWMALLKEDLMDHLGAVAVVIIVAEVFHLVVIVVGVDLEEVIEVVDFLHGEAVDFLHGEASGVEMTRAVITEIAMIHEEDSVDGAVVIVVAVVIHPGDVVDILLGVVALEEVSGVVASVAVEDLHVSQETLHHVKTETIGPEIILHPASLVRIAMTGLQLSIQIPGGLLDLNQGQVMRQVAGIHIERHQRILTELAVHPGSPTVQEKVGTMNQNVQGNHQETVFVIVPEITHHQHKESHTENLTALDHQQTHTPHHGQPDQLNILVQEVQRALLVEIDIQMVQQAAVTERKPREIHLPMIATPLAVTEKLMGEISMRVVAVTCHHHLPVVVILHQLQAEIIQGIETTRTTVGKVVMEVEEVTAATKNQVQTGAPAEEI